MVRTPPGTVLSPDLHALVQHALRSLGKQIDDVLATGKVDSASVAHLTACKARIDRMPAPQFPE
jgi:hypothetical protein